MTIRPMGAKLFNADRRTGAHTDMTKLKVAFRKFASTPNKGNNEYYCLQARDAVQFHE